MAPRGVRLYVHELSRLRRVVGREPVTDRRLAQAACVAAARDAASSYPDEFADGPFPHEQTIASQARQADRRLASGAASIAAGIESGRVRAEHRHRHTVEAQDARRGELASWEGRLADHDEAYTGEDGRRFDRVPSPVKKLVAFGCAVGEVALVKFLADNLGEGDPRLSWAMAVAIVGITIAGAYATAVLLHHRSAAARVLATALACGLVAAGAGVVWLRLDAYQDREAWRQQLRAAAAAEPSIVAGAATGPSSDGAANLPAMLTFGGLQALLVVVVIADGYHDQAPPVALRRRLNRRRLAALWACRRSDRAVARTAAALASSTAYASQLAEDLAALRAETSTRFEVAVRTYREQLVAAVGSSDAVRAGEVASAKLPVLAGHDGSVTDSGSAEADRIRPTNGKAFAELT